MAVERKRTRSKRPSRKRNKGEPEKKTVVTPVKKLGDKEEIEDVLRKLDSLLPTDRILLDQLEPLNKIIKTAFDDIEKYGIMKYSQKGVMQSPAYNIYITSIDRVKGIMTSFGLLGNSREIALTAWRAYQEASKDEQANIEGEGFVKSVSIRKLFGL